MAKSTHTIEERFWSKVDKTAGDCWLWLASKNSRGYGRFAINGHTPRLQRTHRVAWELTYGPIPTGQHILHRCDTPACVRPIHLFVGTHRDNMRDMLTKGRGNKQHGINCGTVRLTDDIVKAVRAAYAEGGISQRALAKQYSVSQACIAAVVRRVSWRHI